MASSRKSRRNAQRHAPESRVPAWVWLFTGCVVGAFIMFLIRLSELKPDATQPVQKTSTASRETKKDTTAKAPRFDFYDVLKKAKVKVPESTPNDTKNPNSAKQPKAQQEYILQVASFKNKDDAEQLKVELLLLNLEAYIEQAQIRNGETWHRVLVGPIESRSKREKIRTTLVANHYEALVLKRAKSPAQ